MGGAMRTPGNRPAQLPSVTGAAITRMGRLPPARIARSSSSSRHRQQQAQTQAAAAASADFPRAPPPPPFLPRVLHVVVAGEGALERLPQVDGDGPGGGLRLAVVLAHHRLHRLSGLDQVVVGDLRWQQDGGWRRL